MFSSSEMDLSRCCIGGALAGAVLCWAVAADQPRGDREREELLALWRSDSERLEMSRLRVEIEAEEEGVSGGGFRNRVEEWRRRNKDLLAIQSDRKNRLASREVGRVAGIAPPGPAPRSREEAELARISARQSAKWEKLTDGVDSVDGILAAREAMADWLHGQERSLDRASVLRASLSDRAWAEPEPIVVETAAGGGEGDRIHQLRIEMAEEILRLRLENADADPQQFHREVIGANRQFFESRKGQIAESAKALRDSERQARLRELEAARDSR